MILGNTDVIAVVPPGPRFAILSPPAPPSVLVLPVAGPAGTGGGSGSTPTVYSGTFSTFSASHSFTYPPPVRLIDSTGEDISIGIEYPDATHVAISFPVPFTGKIIVG
jgi:hypothetical protein